MPTPERPSRRARLIAHLRERPHATVSTGQVMRWYRDQGLAPGRSTARGDLQLLARRGLLIEMPGHDRAYRLNAATEEAPA